MLFPVLFYQKFAQIKTKDRLIIRLLNYHVTCAVELFVQIYNKWQIFSYT